MLTTPPTALASLLTRSVVRWPAGVLGFGSVLNDGTLVVNTKEGLDLLRPGQTTARPIYRYPTATSFGLTQEEAETNGHLVTRVMFNNQTNNDWAMVDVDLSTGASRVIGRPEPDIGDDLMSIAPTAGGGYAAWSQARADMSLEVLVADVATGVTRRVPWRNIAFPHIVDGILLTIAHPSGNWQEPGGDYLVAFDLRTLARVPLPAGLSDVSEPRNLDVTPAGVLWSTTDYTTIHAISTTNPDVLLTANGTAKGFSAEDWPYLSDNGFAGWYQNGGGDGSGVFADLRTGVAVPLANRVYIAGTTVVAETIDGDTVVDSVFSTKELPRLTGCTPTAMPAPPPPSAVPTLSPLDTATATKPWVDRAAGRGTVPSVSGRWLANNVSGDDGDPGVTGGLKRPGRGVAHAVDGQRGVAGDREGGGVGWALSSAPSLSVPVAQPIIFSVAFPGDAERGSCGTCV